MNARRPDRDAGRDFLAALSNPDGGLDVVVDANRGQQTVGAPFQNDDPGLRQEVVTAPTSTVVFHGATHAVVGDHAEVETDSAAHAETSDEEGTQLAGAAVDGIRPD